MRVLGIIPARLGSTRLPHKPLQLLAGEPLITRVVERVSEHGLTDELVVATDSPKVAEAVRRSRARVVITEASHQSGTDRVAEVAVRKEFAGFDLVVNIQGDEPFLSRAALAGSIGRVEDGDDIGTAAAPLDPELAAEPGRVKVVFDSNGRALYFSRAMIPHRRDGDSPAAGLYWQHVGIYAYSRSVIAGWSRLERSRAEQAEQLEQLRALHNGLSVGVAQLNEPVLPGVDTLEDLRRAEAHWHAYQGQV
jgi:3-deoxy-manno-octulosonate cytidylyltransferase (CMP-KDO synthetase)